MRTDIRTNISFRTGSSVSPIADKMDEVGMMCTILEVNGINSIGK